ncbi:MAG: hypothetical protein FD146_188 [Anaerolineaceae bacterium]|nr:MAG: hypothetical protein FD146_188 [Anaerolineaceae bacterium]
MTVSMDLITGLAAFLLTVMVLSYLIGDNPFFRLAIHIFVGVAAGYAGAVAWHQALWPKLFRPIVYGTLAEKLLAVIPLLLGILLLAKLSPRAARLGNPAMAYLVGIGAAVAIGGAVMGTIFPQTAATVNLFGVTGDGMAEKLFEASIVLAGAVTTLVYFHFGAKAAPGGPRRGKFVQALGWVGQFFVAITFGALFAGVYAAAMTALVERIYFIWIFLGSLF